VQWLTVKVPQAPLASWAHVTGTVQIEIAFKACTLDLNSVHIVSRRSDAPQYKKMLEDAALDAVKHSEIGCGDFRDAKTVLTYEFALKSPRKCYAEEATEFTVHNNVVRVVAPERCIETSTAPTRQN
jgi:hypothetical protein